MSIDGIIKLHKSWMRTKISILVTILFLYLITFNFIITERKLSQNINLP